MPPEDQSEIGTDALGVQRSGHARDGNCRLHHASFCIVDLPGWREIVIAESGNVSLSVPASSGTDPSPGTERDT